MSCITSFWVISCESYKQADRPPGGNFRVNIVRSDRSFPSVLVPIYGDSPPACLARERERESLVSLVGLSFIAVHLQLPTFINRRQTTTLHYNQQLRVTLFVRIFGNNLCICSTIRYAEDVMTLLYWEVFCSGLSHDDWNTHSLPRNSVRVVSTITEKPVYLSSHLTSSQQSGIYVRRSRVKNLWNIPPHFYKLLNMSFLTRRNTDVVPIAQKYSLLNLVNTSFFVQFIQRFSFYETSAVRSLVRFTDRNEY